MTTKETEPAVPLAASAWTQRHRRVGWALLVGGLLVIAAGVFVGERESSYAALSHGVATGDAKVVRVSGGFSDEAGVTGHAALALHWRDGLFRYHADVREARPLRAARHGARPGNPLVACRGPTTLARATRWAWFWIFGIAAHTIG
jgi:hypothetical protein